MRCRIIFLLLAGFSLLEVHGISDYAKGIKDRCLAGMNNEQQGQYEAAMKSLASHPDLQDLLHKEIEETAEFYRDTTYDALETTKNLYCNGELALFDPKFPFVDILEMMTLQKMLQPQNDAQNAVFTVEQCKRIMRLVFFTPCLPTDEQAQFDRLFDALTIQPDAEVLIKYFFNKVYDYFKNLNPAQFNKAAPKKRKLTREQFLRSAQYAQFIRSGTIARQLRSELPEGDAKLSTKKIEDAMESALDMRLNEKQKNALCDAYVRRIKSTYFPDLEDSQNVIFDKQVKELVARANYADILMGWNVYCAETFALRNLKLRNDDKVRTEMRNTYFKPGGYFDPNRPVNFAGMMCLIPKSNPHYYEEMMKQKLLPELSQHVAANSEEPTELDEFNVLMVYLIKQPDGHILIRHIYKSMKTFYDKLKAKYDSYDCCTETLIRIDVKGYFFEAYNFFGESTKLRNSLSKEDAEESKKILRAHNEACKRAQAEYDKKIRDGLIKIGRKIQENKDCVIAEAWKVIKK